MSPLVSVIVSVFNRQQVLHYCLDSIKNQTFTDFEVILVNDGSKDGSGNICDEYCLSDKRFRVIHKSNGGVSAARNTGIENAHGEYVLFVDCDDYVSTNYISSFIEAKTLHPDCENIWCSIKTVTDYDGSNPKSYPYDENSTYSMSSRKEIMTLHEKWLDTSCDCKLHKRSLLNEKNLRQRPHLPLGEDLIFNLEYLDATNDEKILIINEPLYFYIRSGNESLDNRYIKNMSAIYEEINEVMFYYADKWQIDAEQLKKLNSACFYKFEATLKNTFHKANSQPFSKKLKYNTGLIKNKKNMLYLKNSSVTLHPLYRFAYKTNNYFSVLTAEWIIKTIKKLIRK